MTYDLVIGTLVRKILEAGLTATIEKDRDKALIITGQNRFVKKQLSVSLLAIERTQHSVEAISEALFKEFMR